MQTPDFATILILSAFHLAEGAWVWLQVNKRGPARSKKLVNEVLDERMGATMRGGLDPRSLREVRSMKEAERMARLQNFAYEMIAKSAGPARAKIALDAIPETVLRAIAKSDEVKWAELLAPLAKYVPRAESTNSNGSTYVDPSTVYVR